MMTVYYGTKCLLCDTIKQKSKHEILNKVTINSKSIPQNWTSLSLLKIATLEQIYLRIDFLKTVLSKRIRFGRHSKKSIRRKAQLFKSGNDQKGGFPERFFFLINQTHHHKARQSPYQNLIRSQARQKNGYQIEKDVEEISRV